MEVEELETDLLCPADVEGITDALAWKACDHEGRRRFAAIRTREGTLVADVRQYAMLGRSQDAECQDPTRLLSTLTRCRRDSWL